MSLFKKINRRAVTTTQTGFGTNSNTSGGRFYSKDGTANKEIRGISFWERTSIYHYLITVSWAKFLLVTFLAFIAVNVMFTTVYYLLGLHQLDGMLEGSFAFEFAEIFFFSVQTYTTVGYGRMNPVGLGASAVASFEALTGLLSFALATGLLYGRFSLPKANLKFSKNALISPYKESLGMMFRMVPYKNHHLSEAEVKVTFALKVPDEDGKMINKFFPLDLEISKINNLTLSWTIVHAINEESPFYNLTKEDLVNWEAELLVYVKAYAETFSNYVVARTSYVAEEFIFGAKFVLMYHPSEDKRRTVLQIDKLDSYDEMDL